MKGTKKKSVAFWIILVLVIIAAITNPEDSKHRREFNSKYPSEALVEELFFADKDFQRVNLGVLSLTKVKNEVRGIGAFWTVYVF